MPPFFLAPSILSADVARLGEEVRAVLDAGVKRIQVDVMDGMFVPNLTFGPLVVDAIAPQVHAAGAVVEAHLMIVDPERYVDEFARAGADLIIVHVEAAAHLHRVVHQVRDLGKRPGVALNPATPLVMLEEILPDVDLVLVMTINPGFGGQELIPATLDKVRRAREMLDARGLAHVDLQVDGGIQRETIVEAARAGANVLVSGSGIYNRDGTPGENIRALRAICAAAGIPLQ
jgi:ribulose-phosphate 3-epimerase